MKHFVIIAAMIMMVSGNTYGADKAVTLLKELEGFRSSVYLDTAGVKTIGYGFTSAAMVGKGKVTEKEATVELDRLCRDISLKLRNELGTKVTLKPNEEAALVSFIYNVGWGAFRKSTMCKLLKQGKRGAAIGCEFHKWVYAKDKSGKSVKVKGLANRRLKEAVMFMVG